MAPRSTSRTRGNDEVLIVNSGSFTVLLDGSTKHVITRENCKPHFSDTATKERFLNVVFEFQDCIMGSIRDHSIKAIEHVIQRLHDGLNVIGGAFD
jgi:hypothetical protein